MKKKTKEPTEESPAPLIRGKTKVDHAFTPEDAKVKTDQLIRLMQEVTLKEEEIKAQVATGRAAARSLQAQVNELANQLRNGGEELEVDCFVQYDRQAGRKALYHNAPGKPQHMTLIREEDMTEEDYGELPMDVEPGKAPPSTAADEAPAAGWQDHGMPE